MPSFLASIKESLKYIQVFQEESLDIFKEIFPELRNHQEILAVYKKFWNKGLKVDRNDYIKSHQTWKAVYPEILKNHNIPYCKEISPYEKILDIINDSSIRREYPYQEDKLLKVIENAVHEQKPVQLFGFWGAGPKDTPDDHDINTINHLKKYLDKIGQVYQYGVEVTFILADKHGESNGYESQKIDSYLKKIKEILEQVGIKTIYLSELWKKYDLTTERVNTVFTSRETGWWEKISINNQLKNLALKYYAGDNVLYGAQKYYIVRKLEKEILEKEFNNHVFFVYGNSLAQQIYPDIPTLYFCTEKKYAGDIPWFNTN